jgi:hypothetical protein
MSSWLHSMFSICIRALSGMLEPSRKLTLTLVPATILELTTKDAVMVDKESAVLVSSCTLKDVMRPFSAACRAFL